MCVSRSESLYLATEDVRIVPLEEFLQWLMWCSRRHVEPDPVERVVASPVVVLIAQASADLQAEFRCDRDVAGVEQTVKIRPQQEAISHIVRPVVRV
jgi:hypothetical protein